MKSLWMNITEKSEGNVIDFSVNTNPFGISERVRESLAEIVDILEFYPDSDCGRLRGMLADKYNISKDSILCGNGADDLLYRLIFAERPRKAVVIEPTFEEYSRALRIAGCEVIHYQMSRERMFDLDDGVLEVLNQDIDMVFLCNPNNPTGCLTAPPLLKCILEKCVQNDSLLVVDECFMEFIPDWKGRTVKQKAADSRKLVVIDAFTKTYALAGFRLGYCISGNQELLASMKGWGQGFGVSVPAQFAGICSLEDKEYMEKTYIFLEEERAWLSERLVKLGMEFVPSKTNYLLLRSPGVDIREQLEQKRMKVRDCSQFYGLGREYCRIAIRMHEENKQLVLALEEIEKVNRKKRFASKYN